jgi:hypothetical protein
MNITDLAALAQRGQQRVDLGHQHGDQREIPRRRRVKLGTYLDGCTL